MGKVTRANVHEALQLQKQQKRPLGQILRELGNVNEEDLQLALAFQIGMEATDLAKVDVGQGRSCPCCRPRSATPTTSCPSTTARKATC